VNSRTSAPSMRARNRYRAVKGWCAELQKGYEFKKDKFIVFSAELRVLEEGTSHARFFGAVRAPGR
jgi:hypothetical protein